MDLGNVFVCVILLPVFIVLTLVIAILSPLIIVLSSIFAGSEPVGDWSGMNFARKLQPFKVCMRQMVLHVLNFICLLFEDVFACGQITAIEEKLKNGELPVAFITGHGRSGSTNLHSSLQKVPGVGCGLMIEMVARSYLFRFIAFRSLSLMENRINAEGKNTKNHAVKPDEPMEESMYLNHRGKGGSFVITCGDNCLEDLESLCKVTDITKKDVEFLRSCIARSIYYHGVPDQMYIGCFLEACPYKVLMECFGNCKIVVTVRKPLSTIRSLMSMQEAVRDPRGVNEKQMKNMFYAYSKKVYGLMLDEVKENVNNPNYFWSDFEDWKADSAAQFSKINKFLGLKNCDGIVPQRKQEGHKNNPDIYPLVPEELVEEEVGATFKEIMTILNDAKETKLRA